MAISPMALRLDPSVRRAPAFSPLLVVALVAGLVLAGAAGGFLLGRSGSESAATDASVADSGQRAAALVIDPLPTSVTNAPITEQGSVQAATGFMVLYVELLNDPGEGSVETISALLAPEASDLQQQLAAELASANRRLGEDDESRGFATVSPVTYRVKSFSPEATHVELWSVSVVAGGPENFASSNWFISDMKLRAENGEWRIVSWSSQNGPVPAPRSGGGAPATPNDLVNVIKEFNEYRYAPATNGGATESSAKPKDD